jgi:hypothetical protein
MPTTKKPKARPINQRLYQNAHQEFKRLCKYMYEVHDGPIASPMVVAPKATNPFIRICGDYREINQYMEASHFPIPDVPKLLQRLQGVKYYIDLDLTNAFHQIRLHPESAAKLSIVTPWAQIRPKFLPEGCKPASHQLQRTVSGLFESLEEHMIVALCSHRRCGMSLFGTGGPRWSQSARGPEESPKSLGLFPRYPPSASRAAVPAMVPRRLSPEWLPASELGKLLATSAVHSFPGNLH